MFRRRRPLLRAAAVGGAGYAIGKHAQEGRDADAEAEEAEEADQQDPNPSGGLSNEQIEQLKKLGELKEQGLLTQEEFDEQKRRLLDSG